MIYDKYVKGNLTRYENFCVGKFNVYYKGFLFIPGLNAGYDSLHYFFKKYDNWENSIQKLYGSYTIIIKEDNQKTAIFTDNSGFHKIYMYGDIISDSFLELCQYLGVTIDNLDYYGIAEFIRMGFMFNHTFIQDIAILNKRNYIMFNTPDTGKQVMLKPLCDINDPGIDFLKFFEELSITLKNHKVVCDLTGGTDSRLIVALCEYFNIDYNISLSEKRNFIDCTKCEELCKILGKKPIFFRYNNDIDEKTFNEVFYITDGQYPVLEYYRNYDYNKNLKNSGFDLRITGGNGEIFKDEWWPKLYFIHNNKKVINSWKNSCWIF